MNEKEQFEIDHLPEKYRPLSAWAYFGYTILYSLPLIGFILLIITAIGGGNVNRRNFARSYFCVYVIAFIIIIVMIALSMTGAIVIGTAGGQTSA